MSSSSMKAYSRLTDNYALVHLRLDEIKGPNAGAAQDVGSIVDIVTDANWQAQIVQARQVFVSHAVDSIVRLMKEPEAVIKLTDAEKAAIAGEADLVSLWTAVETAWKGYVGCFETKAKDYRVQKNQMKPVAKHCKQISDQETVAERERETIGAFDAFAKRTQARRKVVLNEKRVKFGAVSKVALAGTVQQRTEVQRKLETGASSVLVGALESWMALPDVESCYLRDEVPAMPSIVNDSPEVWASWRKTVDGVCQQSAYAWGTEDDEMGQETTEGVDNANAVMMRLEGLTGTTEGHLEESGGSVVIEAGHDTETGPLSCLLTDDTVEEVDESTEGNIITGVTCDEMQQALFLYIVGPVLENREAQATRVQNHLHMPLDVQNKNWRNLSQLNRHK
ncbi:hypothetical protein PHLCEN_2v6787 [Hermanssonia centrifuga]|uniref:Uncharacterized protein n=1 Tax=Hermanssonia centrifuga TaxID=98765 RepID=A0A2R6NYH9_9APHY|nr:hypothetical protein PHLCEN_2v6787 [Hermanssonia centrifuga]